MIGTGYCLSLEHERVGGQGIAPHRLTDQVLKDDTGIYYHFISQIVADPKLFIPCSILKFIADK
jgi:hypothetical protein